VHKEHHKVVGTKERKQFANLVTPKNLTDWLQQMHYLVVQVNERHKG
jgi:hypothetical protein